jgi:hypothetical protein
MKAAAHRHPFPDMAASLPSGLKIRIRKRPVFMGSTKAHPSPPSPKWRRQMARVNAAALPRVRSFSRITR